MHKNNFVLTDLKKYRIEIIQNYCKIRDIFLY